MRKLTKAPKTSNISWLFYKDYFKDEKGNPLFRGGYETENLIKQKTENILNQKLVKLAPLPLAEYLDLTTIYPGLLVGSGYQHELGGVNGEFQLGFFFDYTTGMPTIPGSSVKGVLRSAFEHKEYIRDCLDSSIDIDKLKKEIFGSENGSDAVQKGKDKFFDAFIIESKNRNETFLDDDYITPHSDEFKDPVPLRFLKVSPNVTFRFYFDLTNGIISKEEKLLLFDNILQDFGVGAKTNVGYGQFTGNNEKRIINIINKKHEAALEKEKEKTLASLSPVDKIFAEIDDDIVKIIQMMQKGDIEEFDTIKTELAQRIKKELQKTPKTWENAKKKALTRKEYIEFILSGEKDGK